MCITPIEDDEPTPNLGFSMTWWDRLFGTYRDQPRAAANVG